MNITSYFLDAADKYPTKKAIIEKETSITYSELKQEVLKTAAYFREKGIKNGDRVLVFVPMGVDLYRIVLALFYIGATAVFLDEWVSWKRMELCCKIADCKGFIGIPKARIVALFSRQLRQIPIKLSIGKRSKKPIALAQTDASSTALITFTTGSTGTPKAANRTHGFLKEQFEALKIEINPQPQDVDMSVLPILLFINLGIGGTSVIADFKMSRPDKMNCSEIYNQIEEHQVNRIVASPFFVKKLALFGIENELKYSSVKNVFTGGAPVFPDEAEKYLQAFPDAETKVVYGSTEAEPISSISANDLVQKNKKLEKGLAVGEVFEKTALKIIEVKKEMISNLTKKELSELEVQEGTIGEIIVSGKHVLKEYYKNEEAFKENKIIVDGEIWHRTGDSGLIQNGELLLTGRCKQLIKKESGFISPFIIENQLQQIEGVEMGTLLDRNGEIWIVTESNINQTKLENKIDFIQYNQVVQIDTIPRDPRHNSKIDYGRLQRIFFK